MADDAADSSGRNARRDVKAELDERRIAKGVAMGLPLVTLAAVLISAATLGAPMAILVLAAGLLLGVIALFWASLRILSGDAALAPELEALDATAHAVDALASRKTMLIRALKDLDNERALGKLEDDDYDQLSHTYRGELKELLARIDETLAPHRPKAEQAARTYLLEAGLAEGSYRGDPPKSDSDSEGDDAEDSEEDNEGEGEGDADADATAEANPAKTRLACAKCSTSNEPDATFCKKCGTSLATRSKESDANSDGETKAEAVDEA